jgi:glycosyltransferase involved in cell wall biosynthesis
LPGIEAVTPARNEKDRLRATLEALTEQTLSLDRLVVVNDGSTDATRHIALANGCEAVDLYLLAGRGNWKTTS